MRYLIIVFLLASCANPNKLHKIMDKLPEATAKECAQRFPIKETIETITVTDTAMLQQYEIELQHMYNLIDSLLNSNCDTLIVEKIKQVITKIPSKPTIKYVIKTQESTARLDTLKNQCEKMSSFLNKKLDNELDKVSKLTAKCDKYKKQKKRYLWWVVILAIALIRKPILRFIKSFVNPL